MNKRDQGAHEKPGGLAGLPTATKLGLVCVLCVGLITGLVLLVQTLAGL